MQLLAETVFGSRMWRFNEPDADWDIFKMVKRPLWQVLMSRKFDYSKQKMDTVDGDEMDVHTHDVFHITQQLKKANVTMVIRVLSPTVHVSSPEFEALRDLTVANVGRDIVGSARGIIYSTLPEGRMHKRYAAKGSVYYTKRLHMAYRMGKFTLWFMRDKGNPFYRQEFWHEINFIPTTDNLRDLLDELENLKDFNCLEKTNKDVFDMWLLNLYDVKVGE